MGMLFIEMGNEGAFAEPELFEPEPELFEPEPELFEPEPELVEPEPPVEVDFCP